MDQVFLYVRCLDKWIVSHLLLYFLFFPKLSFLCSDFCATDIDSKTRFSKKYFFLLSFFNYATFFCIVDKVSWTDWTRFCPLLMVESHGGLGASLGDRQASEAWVAPIVAFLKDPTTSVGKHIRRAARAYELKDGVLYRKARTEEGGQTLALVVPRSSRREVLQALHDHPTSGHLGVKKTYSRIRTRFYWPKMFKTVRNYVLSCEGCSRQKRCHEIPEGLLQPLPATSKPFERVGLDKLGPFPESLDGNRHVFVQVVSNQLADPKDA